MIKKLKLFQTDSEYTAFTGTTAFVKPNVSHCVQENHVHYNQRTMADEYLTFEILSGGNITWSNTMSNKIANEAIYYSLNDGAWTELTPENQFIVNDGDTVRFKGNNSVYGAFGTAIGGVDDIYGGHCFSDSTAVFNISGNIMSLILGDEFSGSRTLTKDASNKSYTFSALFRGCEVISAINLILPDTIINTATGGNASYADFAYLFKDCTGLTTAPTALSRTLEGNLAETFEGMFYGCTSLTVAPKLPATSFNPLNDKYPTGCYIGLFRNCTSLTVAPDLPATTLTSGCYGRRNSRGSEDLYGGMFQGCTSLVNPPLMLATTMAASACTDMFNGCTSLTSSPVLYSETLSERCYQGMFSGCSSLNLITCLATDISADQCTQYWISGVASTGTFIKAATMNDWTTDVDGIPSNWTVQNAT